ncbi:MAG TPA: DUF6152 family protein [Bryobacteraceae bacterium]|nr:DUF6152 family protein [Bryobacteraceae bacterium]
MKIRTIFLALASAVPISLFAHHGAAGYNAKDVETVTGTAVDFQFVNPHVLVTISVKDPNGVVTKWQGELTSPNHLVRAGWNAHSIKAGDTVTITGARALTGAPALRISKTVVNGQELKTEMGD